MSEQRVGLRQLRHKLQETAVRPQYWPEYVRRVDGGTKIR